MWASAQNRELNSGAYPPHTLQIASHSEELLPFFGESGRKSMFDYI